MRRLSVLLSLLLLLVGPTTFAQGISTSLQLSIPIEGKLSAGQTHSYTISLTKDQFAQLAVDQRGMDVVVRVFAPDGKLIGKIHLPETCANICFGGAKKNRLFMAASQSLYAVYVGTEGAQTP